MKQAAAELRGRIRRGEFNGPTAGLGVGFVPMYRTNLACRPAGVFAGPMVVSMRPMTPAQAIRAVQVCSRFPRAHGAPVHLGDPEAIGIADVSRPDFGDAVEMEPGEVPVF